MSHHKQAFHVLRLELMTAEPKVELLSQCLGHVLAMDYDKGYDTPDPGRRLGALLSRSSITGAQVDEFASCLRRQEPYPGVFRLPLIGRGKDGYVDVPADITSYDPVVLLNAPDDLLNDAPAIYVPGTIEELEAMHVGPLRDLAEHLQVTLDGGMKKKQIRTVLAGALELT